MTYACEPLPAIATTPLIGILAVIARAYVFGGGGTPGPELGGDGALAELRLRESTGTTMTRAAMTATAATTNPRRRRVADRSCRSRRSRQACSVLPVMAARPVSRP